MAKKVADPNKGKFIPDPNFQDYQKNIDYSQYAKQNSPDNNGYSTGPSNTPVDYTKSSYDPGMVSQEDLPVLNDIRAGNQGVFSSLGNSTAKFIGKTGLNIIGGVFGTVYGASKAVAEGDISKLWDNSFNDKVDELNKGLDDIFKVYKTSDYQEANFLSKVFLHPLQFIDETQEALSFTAGAILTELASQGAASATVLPKALRYMRYLSEGAEAAEATAQLTSGVSKATRIAGDFGRTVRQLATGASYESIIESRQATMQLRNNMYSDWQKEHPNEPMPQNIKDDIDDRLRKAGLMSYVANLALVGSSNMMQFPKIFGLGYRSSRIAEGSIARNLETGLYEAAADNSSRLSRMAGRVASGLKNPLEEGLYEEGLQNVVQNTNIHYWDRKNNKDAKFDVSNYLHDFGTNILDTYTSKDGWNQIGMGMLIGGLGAPGRGILSIAGKDSAIGKRGYNEVRDSQGNITGLERADLWTGGVLGGQEEAREEHRKVAEVVDQLNKNTSLGTAMKANYDFLVQSKTLDNDKEAAIKNNDIFEFNNAKDDQIHSYVSSRIKAGLYEELQDQVDDMKKLSPDEFYTQFKGEESANKATNIEKVQYQLESIDQFTKKMQNTKVAFDIVDNIYKGNNNDLKEELVHAVAASKNLDVREQSMNKQLAVLSDGHISNASLLSSNTASIKESIDNLTKQLDTIAPEEKESVQKEIDNLNKAPNNNLTVDEHNALIDLAKTNPTAFALNKDQIIETLNDSRKLRKRRQDYLDLYNTLYTEKGQRDFEKHQENLAQAIKQQEDAEVAKEAAKEIENQKKKNIEATKKKVDKAITENADEVGGINPPVEDNSVADLPQIETPEVITPEETAVATIERHKDNSTDVLRNDGLVSNLSDELSTDVLDSIRLTNLDYQRTIGNNIAYLGIDKVRLGKIEDEEIQAKTFDIFDDEGNVKINEFVEPKLFSSNYFKPGSKLNLKVPSFEEMKERGLQDYGETEYSNDKNTVERFPIAIISDDKIVGYLPTQDNIKQNVAEEFRETALASNLSLRQQIFDNSNNIYTGSISTKSPGWLILDKSTNQKSLFEALGDNNKLADNVSIAVGKSLAEGALTELYTGVNTFSDGEVINQANLKSGSVYAIVPSSQESKYIAWPMKTTTIGETKASTIVEAIRLFAKSQEDILEKSERQSIDNITEFNIKNFKGLNDFINTMMYASSDSNSPDTSTFKLYKDNLILSKFDNSKKYKLSDIVNNKATRDALISELSNRYNSVKLANLNSNNKFYSYELNNNGVIDEVPYQTYQHYLNNTNVLTSNIRGIKIQDNEYAFTAQPVIGLSDEISMQPKQLEATVDTTKEDELEVVTPSKSVTSESIESLINNMQEANKALENLAKQQESELAKTKTSKKLFDPSSKKPKNLNLDINPEYLTQSTIKSGEDLMKKCLE